jgi:glutamine amidotransferase
MIAIIDYGMGNLYSIWNALKRIGSRAIIVSSPEKIGKPDGIIVPGVGSFRDGMENFRPFLPEIFCFLKEVPVLGICLGLQMFFEKSSEGPSRGIGFIRGKVRRIPSRVRIPQMGWNSLIIRKRSPIIKGIKNDYFFFSHSYYCEPGEDVVVAEVLYGRRIPAIIQKENFYGMQFHPEKSGEKGLRIMKNWVNICLQRG